MNKRRGLGRGLEALIPSGDLEDDEAPRPARALLRVKIGDIRPNPEQPRRTFEPGALSELAESIRQHGVLQPILVRDLTDGFELIAGERRLRAAELAGLTEVPVVIHERVITGSVDKLELALVENLQREDLNPIEQARAMERLHDEFGLTQESIAARVGKSRVRVANTVRLLGLPAPIIRAIETSEISAGHGGVILSLPTLEQKMMAFELVRREHWTVRQLMDWASHHQQDGAPKPREAPRRRAIDAETQALEEEFRRALGTKVILTRFKSGGRLTIEFYSNEEFEALRARLCD